MLKGVDIAEEKRIYNIKKDGFINKYWFLIEKYYIIANIYKK